MVCIGLADEDMAQPGAFSSRLAAVFDEIARSLRLFANDPAAAKCRSTIQNPSFASFLVTAWSVVIATNIFSRTNARLEILQNSIKGALVHPSNSFRK